MALSLIPYSLTSFNIKRQKKIFSNGFESNYTSRHAKSKSLDNLLIINKNNMLTIILCNT